MAKRTTIVTEETEAVTVKEGGLGIDDGIVMITFLLIVVSMVLLVMKSNQHFPA